MITASALAAALNPALDAAIALDPDARRRIERLDGAILALEITGLGISLYAVPGGHRLRLAAVAPRPPAARIAGPPASLARLGTTAGTRVLFSGALQVLGDVTVATAYKRLFDTLDPDWEEALAGRVGDIAAHEGGRAGRAIVAWVRRARADRQADLRAWLVDELEAMPAPAELEDWLAAVDRVRTDTDRLAARVARLERRLGDGDR